MTVALFKGPRSVDWTATAAVKRGDVVRVAGVAGFALADAAKDAVVPLCTHADLVICRKANATVLGPLDRVRYAAPSKTVVKAANSEHADGYVHHLAPAGTTDVAVVWEPSMGVASGTVNPRVEEIRFQFTSGTAAVELTPVNGDPTVVLGSGPLEIIGARSGNDFRVAAGLYFYKFTGYVIGSSNDSPTVVIVRRASDDAVLAISNTTTVGQHEVQEDRESSFTGVFSLPVATDVNLYLSGQRKDRNPRLRRNGALQIARFA